VYRCLLKILDKLNIRMIIIVRVGEKLLEECICKRKGILKVNINKVNII
jgi:hypothetical protein